MDTIHTIPKNRRQKRNHSQTLGSAASEVSVQMGANRLNLACLEQRSSTRDRKAKKCQEQEYPWKAIRHGCCLWTKLWGDQLWNTTTHRLKHASTVTHPTIPMTHKHWASECDRQEQREDAAVTSVSLFRQQRVCNGCSPVTNSEACLYLHSFIHHPQHVANNHKNASYLPRHRDFSCLTHELGTVIAVPGSSWVLHTAQFEFHIVEVFVMVTFSWAWQIHEQHTKSWCGSPWSGIRQTGGKQPCCPTWHLRVSASTEKH